MWGKTLLPSQSASPPAAAQTTVAQPAAQPDDLLSEFRAAASLCHGLGFESWYVLVDKVDETEQTDRDPEKAATLILPLLRNLKVLETPNVAFKFFLWDQVRPALGSDVRFDKIRNWGMSWTALELREMVNERLKAFSKGRVDSLSALVEPDVADVYEQVIQLAMSSPREMVQCIDAVFREHARHSTQQNGAMISQRSLDRGLDEYARRRMRDLYDEDAIQPILRLPKPLFTSNSVQSALRISKQAASTKIAKWTSLGYVERVDDVRSERDDARLVYQYRVREARLKRIIERGQRSE